MTMRSILLLGLLSTVPAAASAQYFGQNRVMYTKFDFEIIHTQHFDIYFYPREREASLDAARMAERSYGRLSTLLNHQFIERKPIILYASSSDFQQTNALGGDIGEATGGVTDFMKHRAIMPFPGAYKDFDHVLMHEMVHQFQYDTWSHGKAGSGVATIIQVNPPLWFAEGMAEYLSLGQITPETAMWLRDAVLQGKLPTIQQLTFDPYIFPYRYGHALWAYIGMRWGDEAVGAILSATLGGGGVEGAFQRILGISLAQLSVQWRDWVQETYLPDVASRQLAAAVGKPLLTKAVSGGTLHVAPALSPDGKQIAYLSERNFFFIDFYLADGETGTVIKRLAKSVFDANYETFRYLSSTASWSPDSRYLVFAAKAKDYDDIVVFDPRKSRAIRRIHVDLNGITSPVFSPDGKQLAFSGQNGGISDLYVVNADGSGLQQLTNDKYAQLMPAWSPDGHTIAYVTDEGPATSFTDLSFGNLRVALFDLNTDQRELLPHMESGRNISPQWAPDGKSFAFVSDRTGIANIYLYEMGGDVYQLTNLFTGAQSATPLSPALSWARGVDRLAFVYFEDLNNDVYTIQNPRALKREPWRPAEPAPVAARTDSAPAAPPTDSAAARADSGAPAVAPARADSAAAPLPGVPQVREGGSIYRTPTGFRAAAQAPVVTDTAGRRMGDVTVIGLLDSASLFLPDTTSFTIGPYKRKFTAESSARPSVGYTRDNFGNGLYGGGAIQFGDMLGDEQLIFAAYINGSLNQGDFLAAYANLSRRLNWAVGFQQTPTYYVLQPVVIPGNPTPSENRYVTSTRLITTRQIFGRAFYNLSRFQRFEMGLALGQWDESILSFVQTYDRLTGQPTKDPFSETFYFDGQNAMTPSLALVYDATFMGWIGPLFGTRYRIEIAQTMGGWNVTQLLADYRRYIPLKGPIILAARALYTGRRGPDANRQRFFLGSTDLVRGRTSGSYYRYECTANTSIVNNSLTGCYPLDQMVGTEIAVGNLELRFPLVNSYYGIGPKGLPYVDGVAWIDYGVAWNDFNTVAFTVNPDDTPAQKLLTRTPVTTLGFGARMNLFGYMILRADFAYPQGRGIPAYWTISIGPPF